MVETIRITSKHVVDQMMRFVYLYDGMHILEPSAGFGHLLDGIDFNDVKIGSVDCIELNQKRREILIKKGYTVVGKDFFEFKTDKLYDLIIAAPNSVNSVDIEHVIKMYSHTREGGVIVSLMGPEWMIGELEIHKKFREWIKDKNYRIVMLEDNSFIENFKTRPTIIIMIIK